MALHKAKRVVGGVTKESMPAFASKSRLRDTPAMGLGDFMLRQQVSKTRSDYYMDFKTPILQVLALYRSVLRRVEKCVEQSSPFGR